jgi:DUF4097 and DUF4098 domain-containing protein YvlB
MTRQEYIDILRSYLTECSVQEAQELIDDVNQHFDEAAEFGLSEEQTCERLGDPHELAKEYVHEIPVHAQATATLGTQRGEYSGVRQLTMELAHCDIEIFRSENENTIIDILDTAANEENRIEALFDMGHLKIRQRRSYTRILAFLGLGDKKCTARVWLGTDFVGDLKAATGSGSVYITGISANNLSLATGSGHLQAVSIGANKVAVKSASGGITLSTIQTEKLSINGASGTIRTDHISAPEISCNVASGAIKMEQTSCQQASLVTASGSITFDCADICNVNATTASGAIRISLPAWEEMTINTILASGHVNVGYPASSSGSANKRQFVVGSGVNTVNCKSASGSISITPREP